MQLKDPGTLLQVAQEEHGEVRHSSMSAMYRNKKRLMAKCKINCNS